MKKLSPVIAAFSLLAAAALAQNPNRMQVVMAVYNGEQAAELARDRIEGSGSYLDSGLLAHSVVSKTLGGKTQISQGRSRSPLAGRVINAVSRLVGAPRGADMTDESITHQNFLRGSQVNLPTSSVYQLKGALQPGTSALVTVVEDRWAGEARRRMADAGIGATYTFPISPTVQ